jgi:hypothetical protein
MSRRLRLAPATHRPANNSAAAIAIPRPDVLEPVGGSVPPPPGTVVVVVVEGGGG